MKFKSLLFAAAAGMALSAGAVVQGTLTADNITITDENVGQPIRLAISLSDMGTITGQETGYWKYTIDENTKDTIWELDDQGNKVERYTARIGDNKMWKNIQFNLTFPEGLRPVKVNYDDNDNCYLDDSEDGFYDEAGSDVVMKGRPPVPQVTYSNNFGNPEKYPNHIVVGANLTAVWNPAGEVYAMYVAADEDMPNGEYDLMVYSKWIDQCDGDNTIFTDEERGVLCHITVARTVEPETKTIAGIVVDEEDAPLAGVSVTATPEEGEALTATTVEDGTYSIEAPADVVYTLTFALEGYVTQEGVTEEEAVRVVMVKEAPATRVIEGTVVDSETNEPIEGVAVTATELGEDPAGLFRAPGDTFDATTDADGHYSVEVPADAEYQLTFAKDGYLPQTVGETEAENVQLVKDIDTAVNDVNAAKAVASVKYINAAGVASDNAFEGVNIVVTKYADGSQSVTKVVK